MGTKGRPWPHDCRHLQSALLWPPVGRTWSGPTSTRTAPPLSRFSLRSIPRFPLTTTTRSGPSASAVGASTGIITVQCTSSLISLHVSLSHYTASRRVTHLPAWSAQRHLAWHTPQRGSPHSPQTDTTVHLCTSLVGCYTAAPSQRHTQYTQAHTRYSAQCHSAGCAHAVHSLCSRGGAEARGAAASHAQHAHTHGGLALLVATTLLIRLVVPTAPPPLRPISLSLPIVCCTHHRLLAESLAFARPPARPR